MDIPLCCLQGTLAGIMVAFWLLPPISNKLTKYVMDLLEIHTSTTYTHFKIVENALGLDTWKMPDFLRLV